jgi:hypothetical protein
MSVSLEPRLQEYLNKKDYYEKNGILAENLEEEYRITKKDISKIKAYLRKDYSTYDKSGYRDMIDPTESYFPSEKFGKDQRFDRLKKKQERDKEAQEKRHNYDIMTRSYDMYRNDRDFASAFGDDFASKTDTRDYINNSRRNSCSLNINPYEAQPNYNLDSISQNNTYDVNKPIVENKFTQPRSRFNGYVPFEDTIKEDPNSLDMILNELNNYNKNVNRVISNPDINTNIKQRETVNDRFNVPFKSGPQISDIDVDTYCRFGQTPSRAGKSLGYPNPVEHYFDYISNDMQLPEHVVSSRPQDTRHFNKKEARPLNSDMNNRKVMR